MHSVNESCAGAQQFERLGSFGCVQGELCKPQRTMSTRRTAVETLSIQIKLLAGGSMQHANALVNQ